MNNNTAASYFMGANTPGGFVSLFDGLYDPAEGWRLIIIKGGPGTGKSTLMKKLAAQADSRGIYCERIYCSSDPSSLDAVILPQRKLSIADGTPPHILEPKYPGVSEVIFDLGRFRDDVSLRKNAEEILRKTDLISREHRKCVDFLAAAKSVDNDASRLLLSSLRTGLLAQFARGLSEKEIGSVTDAPGKEKKRFLNAYTPEGEVVFTRTLTDACERRIVLEDEYGVAASAVLSVMKNAALQAGQEVIRCLSPTDPQNKTEHLILPGLSLGLFTANSRRPFGARADKTVDCRRFSEPEQLKKHRSRLAFDRRAKEELLAEAVEKLRRAKKLHDELEEYYIRAMDHSAVEEETEKLIASVFDRE